MRRLQSLIALTIASIKMYFRNVSAVFFTLFIPLVFVMVFGLISSGSGGVSIGIGLNNQSQTPLASQFVTQLKSVKSFKVTEADQSTLIDKLGKGKIDLEVIVPPNFGRTVNGQLLPAKILAYYNQARPQTGQTASLVLGQMVAGINAHLAKTPEILSLDASGVQTSNLSTIDFILPGIIALTIMQLGIFSVAFAFISFKTTGALRRLQAAPIHPFQFIIAQSITRLIIGVLQACLLTVLGMALFHMHLLGNIGLFLSVAIFGTIVFLFFGFMVAGIAHDENQAAPLVNLIAFPQFFLANIFFSNESFPHWLQVISNHLPLAYLADAMRRIANEGVGITAIRNDILGLLVWGVLAAIIAVRVFNWE